MATLSSIKCNLCDAMGKLIQHRCYGIKCNQDYYLDKAHRYYKYQWLKESVTCGIDSDIDCMINAETP